MSKQDVLGLQIAVNHPLALKKNQRTEHLLAEATDEMRRKALKLVSLDKFVQVHTKELGRYAKVATEIEALREVDHAVLVVGILAIVS